MHLAFLCFAQYVEDVTNLKLRSKTGGVPQKVTEEPNMNNWGENQVPSSWLPRESFTCLSPSLVEYCFPVLPTYPQLQRSHSHSCRCFYWYIPNSTLGLFSWAEEPLKAPSSVPGLQKGLCCPEVCPLFPLVLAGLMGTWLLPTNLHFPLQK